MKCAMCHETIRFPTGEVDPTALKGDLCESCLELDAERVAQHVARLEDERLAERLRRRP